MKAFAQFHPVVLLFYFGIVIGLTMFMMNPLFLVISLVNALVLACTLTNLKSFQKGLRYFAFLFLIIAVTNPLFVHDGMTILFFINNKPITLESFYYGLAIAAMLIAVIYWFQSFNQVLTSEKIIYLFGRIAPAFALMLSMTLGMIAKTKRQMRKINDAQKTMGMDIGAGSILARLKSSMRTISILITWLLENGVDTADSMRARGYGLHGRTTYSPYRFTKRDAAMLGIIGILFVVVLISIKYGANQFYYYPTISISAIKAESIIGASAFLLLSSLPIVVQIKEVFQWRWFQSKM